MMELIMTAPDLMLTQRTQSQALYSDYRNRWELHMQGRKKGRVSSASPGCKQSSFWTVICEQYPVWQPTL